MRTDCSCNKCFMTWFGKTDLTTLLNDTGCIRRKTRNYLSWFLSTYLETLEVQKTLQLKESLSLTYSISVVLNSKYSTKHPASPLTEIHTDRKRQEKARSRCLDSSSKKAALWPSVLIFPLTLRGFGTPADARSGIQDEWQVRLSSVKWGKDHHDQGILQ